MKHEVLDAWLERNNARHLWSQEVDGVGRLTSWLINGRPCLVMVYRKGAGWELFVPASSHNDTAATLNAAAVALGCEGSAGLL